PAALGAPPRVPLVLTVQGAEAALLSKSRLARWFARPVFRRAAVLTAVTRQAGEVVQQVSGRHLATVPVHPLPVDSRGHFWTRGGEGAVLTAPLNREGRVGLALETVAVLASCGHDLTLTVIGDGPERSALERQAQRLGIGALVRFLGPMPLDQARAHLARADLMLLTARGDGSTGAALEALITGVPIVACWDSGAVVELVPESGSGRLSIPSAEALADCVISLQSDPARLQMGRLVGEAWRARLAPDHVAQLCEGWYRDALGR
ncbi:MAG TPA: glycosyltransferase, partial [Gemmatimonadales bacterium]